MRALRWIVPVLAVALAAWWWRAPRTSIVATKPAKPVAARDAGRDAPIAVVTPAVRAPSQTRTAVATLPQAISPVAAASHDEPLPQGTFAAIKDELARRATAGDARAAARLVQIYGPCRRRALGDKIRSDGGFTKAFLDSHGDPEFADVGRAEVAAAMDRVRAERERACAGLDLDPKSMDVHDFWHWLSVAAADGDVPAMLNYARFVVRTYPAVKGLKRGRDWSALAHIEDIERYRDQAVAYLQQVFDRGVPRVLFIYAQQYTPGRGSLFAPDPVRAAAYLLAYRTTSAMRWPIARKLSWANLGPLWSQLNDAQRDQAQAIAAGIESRFVEQPQ